MSKPYRPNQPADSERNRLVAADRAAGLSLTEIADKYGISRSHVVYISKAVARTNGHPPPPVGRTSEKIREDAKKTAEAVQRYLAGEDVAEIARALGIRQRSVYARVSNAGASRPRIAKSKKSPWDAISGRIVFRPGGCWEWLGAKNRKGYAVCGLKTRPGWYFAHRAVYEMLVGPIAPGMTIDHLCRERGCVHPGHMDVCTPLENFRRGIGCTPGYKVGLWR